MKVYMIGGTGLLGSAAAAEFIKRGHSVKSVALPPLPEGAPIPEEMELVFGNYLELSDAVRIRVVLPLFHLHVSKSGAKTEQ